MKQTERFSTSRHPLYVSLIEQLPLVRQKIGFLNQGHHPFANSAINLVDFQCEQLSRSQVWIQILKLPIPWILFHWASPTTWHRVCCRCRRVASPFLSHRSDSRRSQEFRASDPNSRPEVSSRRSTLKTYTFLLHRTSEEHHVATQKQHRDWSRFKSCICYRLPPVSSTTGYQFQSRRL